MDILTENGYVVYTRTSGNRYWENIRSLKEAQVKNLMAQLPQADDSFYQSIGDNLIALGNMEREKELNLIEKAFGVSIPRSNEYPAIEKEFIQKFNEILIGEEQYKRALAQIKEAKKNYEDGKKSLAPTLSSLFLGKLNKFLVPAFKQYVQTHKQQILHHDTSGWETMAEQILEDASEKALEELFTTTSKDDFNIFGTYATNVEMFEEFTRNKGIFFDLVKEKINLDNVRKILSDHLKDIQNVFNNGGRMYYHKWIGENIHTKTRAGQIGGSIDEFFTQLRQSIAETLNASARKGLMLGNEMQKIDNALIMTFESQINLNNILENLNKEMLGGDAGKPPTDLVEAGERMSEYYEKHLSNLTQSFVIFSSNKAYGFNNYSSYGFQNDKQRGIGELRTVLTQGPGGMSVSKAQDFIDVVINAMPGAVLEKRRDEIKTLLRYQIYNAMAYLLFDDWVAIGKTESIDNAIHVFSLDTIQIPLSALLIGAGNAIKDADSSKAAWFRTTIHYPEYVKFKGDWENEEDYPKFDSTRKKGKVPDVAGAWEVQRIDASTSVNFSTHFLSNFTKIIEDYLK